MQFSPAIVPSSLTINRRPYTKKRYTTILDFWFRGAFGNRYFGCKRCCDPSAADIENTSAFRLHCSHPCISIFANLERCFSVSAYTRPNCFPLHFSRMWFLVGLFFVKQKFPESYSDPFFSRPQTPHKKVHFLQELPKLLRPSPASGNLGQRVSFSFLTFLT